MYWTSTYPCAFWWVYYTIIKPTSFYSIDVSCHIKTRDYPTCSSLCETYTIIDISGCPTGMPCNSSEYWFMVWKNQPAISQKPMKIGEILDSPNNVWYVYPIVFIRPLRNRCPDIIGAGGLGVSPSFSESPKIGGLGGWLRLFRQSHKEYKGLGFINRGMLIEV